MYAGAQPHPSNLWHAFRDDCGTITTWNGIDSDNDGDGTDCTVSSSGMKSLSKKCAMLQVRRKVYDVGV